jgi:hypothetical protein
MALVRLRLRERSLALQEKKLELKRLELEKANPRSAPQPPPELPVADESQSPASHSSQTTPENPEKHNEPVQESCGKTQLYAKTPGFRPALFSSPAAPVNGESHRPQLPGFPK